MSLIDIYQSVGSAASLDQQRAEQIVADALPHAVAALQHDGALPVRVACVSPAVARGGSLIPAWPIRQPDDSVVIEYVADWGVMLAGWLSTVSPAERPLARRLVERGDRVWIGISNDVVQLFVQDPPVDQYSMVRHHGLMLAAATTWLGPQAVTDWRTVHASAAHTFLERHAHDPLHQAIAQAESGLSVLLVDARSRQPSPACIEWLEADASARAAYQDYLGAASLGVAAILDALPAAGPSADRLIAHAMANEHSRPDFNRDWIQQCAARLLEAVPLGR